MAKCHVSNVDDPRRPPSMRRTVMIDTSRGVLRVRKWPTPRPGPRNTTNTCWTEWLRQAMAIYRHADPQLVEYYRQVTCGLPAKVTDPFISNSRGSFAAWPITRNIYMYPRQAVRKVAYSLDVISQIPGSILVRHHDMWRYIEPGPAGSVLTSMGPYQVPKWSTDGRSGLTPPSPDTLPVEVNTSQLTIEQSPYGPLVLRLPRAASGDNIAARLTTYPTPPMSVTTVVTAAFETNAYYKIGLAIWEQPTNRLVTWTWANRADTRDTAIEWTYWSSPTQYGGNNALTRLRANAPIWLRLTDTGVTLRFEYSLDGAAWQTYATLPRDGWITTPTHIGVAIISHNSGSLGPTGSIHHWEVETL